MRNEKEKQHWGAGLKDRKRGGTVRELVREDRAREEERKLENLLE